jgi:hypothetical protein
MTTDPTSDAAAEMQRAHEALSRIHVGLLNEDRSDATLSERVNRLASRCEDAEDKVADLQSQLATSAAEVERLKAEIFEWDAWCADMAHVGYELVDRLEEQTEGWTRPVRPIVLGATLIEELREAVKLPKALGGDENGKGKTRTPPEPGAKLLCLVCAYEAPWGVWDSKTGAAVCVTCRDKAQFQVAAASFADVTPLTQDIVNRVFKGTYVHPTMSRFYLGSAWLWIDAQAGIAQIGNPDCTTGLIKLPGEYKTVGALTKLLAALRPGGEL